MNKYWVWIGWLLLVSAVPLRVEAQKNAGRQFADLRGRVVLRNLTRLNTRHIEFSPAYFRDGMVFVSSRQKGGYIDENLGETYFDLFFTRLDAEGSPGRIKPFSLELNSPLHEGPLTFSPDERTVFFTRNNQSGAGPLSDQEGRITLKIYQADWGPYNDWLNVRELPFNSDTYSCMHPALTPDGKRMYFSSDMPGGFGQRDIYMVELTNGKWSDPINLGPRINTAGNESYPFFHESGYFFFASDGHPGEGGLDLYMMDMTDKRWGELINLGTPFNTPDDDFGFLMHLSGMRGYFSSNRQDGLGKDDLYMFMVPDGLGGIQVVKDVLSQVQVWDADTRRALSDTDIYLLETNEFGDVPDSQNALRNAMEAAGNPTARTNARGEARLQLDPEKSYLILAAQDGYQPYRLQLYAGGMPPRINIKLDPVDCVTLYGTIEDGRTGGVVEGAQVYIRNGCTGEEVVLESSASGKYTYCLEIGCSFVISAEKPGFVAGSTSVSTERLRGNRSFRAGLRLQPDERFRSKGSTPTGGVPLPAIQFERWAARLLPGSFQQIDRLTALLRSYPDLEIELGAHTDTRGDEILNQRLSLRRAEAVQQLLIERGIAASRLKAFGYGESFPLNHCREGVACSEAEHQQNRRLEIRIRSSPNALTPDQLQRLLQTN